MRERRSLKGFAFRNLHQKGVTYSIRNSEGKTILHTYGVLIKDAEFVVSASGREKVRSTGKKTVHAGVRGEVVTDPVEIAEVASSFNQDKSAYYNPYKVDTFVDAVSGESLSTAKYVFLTSKEGKPRVLYA